MQHQIPNYLFCFRKRFSNLSICSNCRKLHDRKNNETNLLAGKKWVKKSNNLWTMAFNAQFQPIINLYKKSKIQQLKKIQEKDVSFKKGIISLLFFVKMYCCLKRLIFIVARLLKKLKNHEKSRLHSTSRKKFYFFSS